MAHKKLNNPQTDISFLHSTKITFSDISVKDLWVRNLGRGVCLGGGREKWEIVWLFGIFTFVIGEGELDLLIIFLGFCEAITLLFDGKLFFSGDFLTNFFFGIFCEDHAIAGDFGLADAECVGVTW